MSSYHLKVLLKEKISKLYSLASAKNSKNNKNSNLNNEESDCDHTNNQRINNDNEAYKNRFPINR